MKKLGAGIIGLILAFAIVGLYMYNKPHKNMSKQKPDYALTAKELSVKYGTDEDGANKLYLGKIVQIKGKVLSDQQSTPDQRIIILEGDDLVNIQCELTPDNNGETPFSIGETIRVKGLCTGMLLDVIMNDCVIENQK